MRTKGLSDTKCISKHVKNISIPNLFNQNCCFTEYTLVAPNSLDKGIYHCSNFSLGQHKHFYPMNIPHAFYVLIAIYLINSHVQFFVYLSVCGSHFTFIFDKLLEQIQPNLSELFMVIGAINTTVMVYQHYNFSGHYPESFDSPYIFSSMQDFNVTCFQLEAG